MQLVVKTVEKKRKFKSRKETLITDRAETGTTKNAEVFLLYFTIQFNSEIYPFEGQM